MTTKLFRPASTTLLFAGFVLAASCGVDKDGLTFDDDAFDELKNGDGDGDGLGGTGDGDGDGDGDGSGGMGMGGSPDVDPNMPGDVRCSEKQVEFYVGGDLWVALGDECEFVCSAGECTGSCPPESSECISGVEARTCSDLGEWVTVDCPFACVGDACGGECVPGHRKCEGAQRQICDETGTWTDDGEPCGSGICVDSGDGESAACGGDCVLNDTQCTGVKTLEICTASGWAVHDESPCPNVCVAAEGACGGSCSPGTSICQSNSRVTCNLQGEPGSPVPCNGQSCIEGKCVGSCEPGQVGCFQGNVAECKQGQWVVQTNCEELGREMRLEMSCRVVGPEGEPEFVCGECPFGSGETEFSRCHTTDDHGIASETCKYDPEREITLWDITRENCETCYQGKCDLSLEELCQENSLARGCAGVSKQWTCSGAMLNHYECTKASDSNTYCELNSCVAMEEPPLHFK